MNAGLKSPNIFEQRDNPEKDEIVFPLSVAHNTQSKEGKPIPFLLNMFRVLNLSLSNNQKKTICLCWHLVFQILFKISLTLCSPIKWR